MLTDTYEQHTVLQAINACTERSEFDETHANLRTLGAIEDLLKNIDYISIDEIEEFVNKHRKI